MSEYEVSAKTAPIDFGATGKAAVLQNIRMILTTPQFSVPLDRDFAWDPDIDAPINVVTARQSTRIAAAIRKYEPRAQFLSVTFKGDPLNGVLKPTVKVSIAEGV